MGETDHSAVFVDGTKLESRAGRYTFVWRKLKNDFGFRRFLTRGKANIRSELFRLAMAFDLKKLWIGVS